MAVFELILCIIAAVVVSSFVSRFVPKVSTPLVQIVLGVLVIPGCNARPGTVHGAVYRAIAVFGSPRNR